MSKVFCVGGHKNGTLTLHIYFIANRFRSVHGNFWINDDSTIEHYDCFSDNFGEFGAINFAKIDHLAKKYPNSKFILNFRNLDNYIVSLFKHLCYNSIDKKKWNIDKINKFDILARIYNTHITNKYVIDYFITNKMLDRLLVIDICNGNDNINKKLLDKFLGINSNKTIKKHDHNFNINHPDYKKLMSDHQKDIDYVKNNLLLTNEQYYQYLESFYQSRIDELVSN